MLPENDDHQKEEIKKELTYYLHQIGFPKKSSLPISISMIVLMYNDSFCITEICLVTNKFCLRYKLLFQIEQTIIHYLIFITVCLI